MKHSFKCLWFGIWVCFFVVLTKPKAEVKITGLHNSPFLCLEFQQMFYCYVFTYMCGSCVCFITYTYIIFVLLHLCSGVLGYKLWWISQINGKKIASKQWNKCHKNHITNFVLFPFPFFPSLRCARDPTYRSYLSLDRRMVQFRFRAPSFISRYSSVYLQCKMAVCDRYDYSSRCYQGCIARGKRSTRDGDENVITVVSRLQ